MYLTVPFNKLQYALDRRVIFYLQALYDLNASIHASPFFSIEPYKLAWRPMVTFVLPR